MELYHILQDFMLTPAPSGYELEMARKMKDYLGPWCCEVELDRMGNCIGLIKGTGEGPRVMVFAHMDQLGFIVRKVEADGFLQVDRLGGVPEKVLPGLRVWVRSEEGNWIPGVIGVRSHHAELPEEKYKVAAVTSLHIDLGAKTAEEVQRRGIFVGCPAVYAPSFSQLMGTRVSGTAVDNRGACAALVRIAQELHAVRPQSDVYLVGTVWEEFNLRGAMLAARSIQPEVAIGLDVALAGDTRDLATRYDDRLGEGPCVQLYSFHGRGTLNGTLPHEPLFRLAKRAAVDCGIPLQRFATVGMLTDMSYLQLEGKGLACLEMGFPARYTHTPVEVCDVSDLERLAVLVSEMARRINGAFQLNRY